MSKMSAPDFASFHMVSDEVARHFNVTGTRTTIYTGTYSLEDVCIYVYVHVNWCIWMHVRMYVYM